MATMAEQIDEHRKMISDLTARIEGLEKRQAKLACADTSTVACDGGGNGTGEPPPPYSVLQRFGDDVWVVYRASHGKGPNISVGEYISTHMALIIRDHRNAAYMQGWRDRDEQGDDDGE
jgi:hypothetical protein